MGIWEIPGLGLAKKRSVGRNFKLIAARRGFT